MPCQAQENLYVLVGSTAWGTHTYQHARYQDPVEAWVATDLHGDVVLQPVVTGELDRAVTQATQGDGGPRIAKLRGSTAGTE
jgi:hypothetical protein